LAAPCAPDVGSIAGVCGNFVCAPAVDLSNQCVTTDPGTCNPSFLSLQIAFGNPSSYYGFQETFRFNIELSIFADFRELIWFRRNHLFQKIAVWGQSTAGVAMICANRPAVYVASIRDISAANLG
jgi:hypothetical protein